MRYLPLVHVLILTIALPAVPHCIGAEPGEPVEFQCNDDEEKTFLGKLLQLPPDAEFSIDEAVRHFEVEPKRLAETTGNARVRGYSWRFGNGTVATLLFHQTPLILYHASMYRIRGSQEIERSSHPEKFMLHPMYWERGNGLTFSLSQHFHDLSDTERILDAAIERAKHVEALKR